jgi:hypothetical protein
MTCGGGGWRGSAEASSVAHHSLRKRDYLGVPDRSSGKGAAFLTAGGQATGAISVLLAVDPLEQDIKHEVTAKNAKRQEHRDGHVGLPRTDTDGFQGQGKSRGGTLENPEMFVRNSLGRFAGKGAAGGQKAAVFVRRPTAMEVKRREISPCAG